MKFFEISIPGDLDGFGSARLECYLLSMSPKIRWKERPAVILCPGGAYSFTNDRESEPMAMSFMARGFHAFSLRYSVDKGSWPAALRELALAVKTVRDHAAEWNVDPRRIVIAGFSAGGHLAAEFCCKWDTDWLCQSVGARAEELRPNALVLGYPVITAGEYAHGLSIENLLGEQDSAQLRQAVSLEKQVTDSVPPVFLWHTQTDEMVPVQNSLLFASALTEHGIPYELHIYPCGVHGLGLVNRCTVEHDRHVNHYCGGWFDEACAFLDHHLQLER